MSTYGLRGDAINPYWHSKHRQARVDGMLEEEFSDENCSGLPESGCQGYQKSNGQDGYFDTCFMQGSFEAVGLAPEIIEKCFVGTSSRISGVGFDVIAEEGIRRHEIGYPTRSDNACRHCPMTAVSLAKEGEAHAWNPHT